MVEQDVDVQGGNRVEELDVDLFGQPVTGHRLLLAATMSDGCAPVCGLALLTGGPEDAERGEETDGPSALVGIGGQSEPVDRPQAG